MTDYATQLKVATRLTVDGDTITAVLNAHTRYQQTLSPHADPWALTRTVCTGCRLPTTAATVCSHGAPWCPTCVTASACLDFVPDETWTVPCDECGTTTSDATCCDHGREQCSDCVESLACRACAREALAEGAGR